MPQDELTPTNENALAETHEAGSDDEAAAKLAALLEADNTQDDDSKPEDEPEADADAEPDEGETEEAEPTEELVEEELDGVTYKVPKKVQEAMLRQAEFSRRMAETQAEKKAATQSLEKANKLIESAEKLSETLAEVKTFDARIKEFEKLNWQKIRAENPGEYAALSADFNTLRIDREAAANKAQKVDREIAETKQAALAEQRAQMEATLRKDIKGWGEDLGTKLTTHALELGVKIETLQALTDPGIVKALNDAMKYAALQKGKAEVKAKAQAAPPVLKPGAKRPNAAPDPLKRLQQTKSADDAELAFLARMK